eukprot:SAG11_NODE_253_length_11591_cov_15.933693_14_plen_104_part_00
MRDTDFSSIHHTAGSINQGSDYDATNPSRMHTDQASSVGTPSFLHFMYQVEGSIQSMVSDGLAMTDHLRMNHPDAFEILSTVPITHSFRNERHRGRTHYRPSV